MQRVSTRLPVQAVSATGNPRVSRAAFCPSTVCRCASVMPIELNNEALLRFRPKMRTAA